ncbi:exodeoxyribonuclease V subunit alpha [Vibrio sonorensis]|uniref:exodeoxyribonuclease V subunit alpha n=1 Tax=Vibrio sonorensis TaxID=1004316 RepID=UPI0008D9123C|nr:exodeoxyribonuclease V subunit alpha [Vibrio sonorensis]
MMTTTEKPVLTLLDWIAVLSKQGTIRQLDYQFGLFIHQHSQSESLAFLATIVSTELGKGHICLPISSGNAFAAELVDKLGLYGEQAKLLESKLLSTNWVLELEQSSLVGSQGEAVPLMFDGKRLYLHRYWLYEHKLADKLKSFGTPVIFSTTGVPEVRELLDHLFARTYYYLYSNIDKQRAEASLTSPKIQQLVCDHLDVVIPEDLDWPAIGQVVQQAKQAADLSVLDTLVPERVCINWQKVAAAVALSRNFAVISGGPGTGKTTTVTKLLAALIEQASRSGEQPEIKLVAPTGKAAARLTESIGKAVSQLGVSQELKDAIPTQASTIHRLLGALPHSAEFRHNSNDPLHLDILVVDEASMVDLSMMFKLIDALPNHARLILLGDKDQLASVEAGAVLGDICSFHTSGYSDTHAKMIADMTGYEAIKRNTTSLPSIADSLCMLRKSYRFDARSGIGQLARAVNKGDKHAVQKVWQAGFTDITHWPLSGQAYSQMLQDMVEGYQEYLEKTRHFSKQGATVGDNSDSAKQVLAAFNHCRLLCAIREGEFGIVGLNQRIERALTARRLIAPGDRLWYHGRPIMVTKNDHGNGLYNGDIGICMYESEEEGARLKVYFELPDGAIKAVLPSRVPSHETAYAMTIHKSQGSEFEHTLMILPPDFSPILTRELIYTGITRAKKRLTIYSDSKVLIKGIASTTQRASGLVDRLVS